MVLSLFAGCAAKNTDTMDTRSNTDTDTDTDTMVSDNTASENTDAKILVLSDNGITLDGNAVDEDASSPVYISHDIVYYEDKTEYESGNAYGEGSEDERHTAEEATEHTVVNIAEAGTYSVSGTLSKGQLLIDLGEDAKTDETAVVELVLDGANVTCTVAPAIVFKNVYECCADTDADSASSTVDTSAAGAIITIASGSVNTMTGSHVAKIYKDSDDQKKLVKQDGAVYSYMSMNVEGGDTGTLNIIADNEGIDTEMHLTINGGNINITSNDDGINTNEDGVSVTTINGGNLHIVAGLGSEGDGIDSNGWLVINGGTVISSANPASDAGLDSDLGSYVNGGTVVALGSTMDWAESDSDQVTMNLQFAEYKNSGDAIVVTTTDGEVIFAYDPSEDELLGANERKYMGAVISCPDFEVGETYNVYIGGAVEGEELAGVYSSVKSYSAGTLQSYTGTDVFGRDRMMPEGMPGEKPEVFDGEQPELPEDFNGELDGRSNRMEMTPPENPDGLEMTPPENPDGFEMTPPDGGRTQDGNMPALPDGTVVPDFFAGEDGRIMAVGDPSTEFYMQDKVNCFSGVSNA